jgi:hypothetical protein
MNEHRFDTLIDSIWSFLHGFYNREKAFEPRDFIIFAQHNSPRLLIDERPDTDEAFIAVEFPRTLRKDVINSSLLNPQSLSVVCEELSHFFHLTGAAELNHSISVLDLETIAEIDRFLCFMHWNDFYPAQKIRVNHENCHELCDTLFEKRTFRGSDEGLYRDAESRAFHHIKKAFSHCWTKRWIDTSRFDPVARAYLIQQITEITGTRRNINERLTA